MWKNEDAAIDESDLLTLNFLAVTQGWTEALQLMKEGAKWELYIKSELGYGTYDLQKVARRWFIRFLIFISFLNSLGDRGAGGLIPGGAVLVFELELLEVKAAQ